LKKHEINLSVANVIEVKEVYLSIRYHNEWLRDTTNNLQPVQSVDTRVED